MINTAKLKRYVLPNLPYAGMFYFFSKCAEAYSIAPKKDVLQKIMYGIGNLNTVLARPPLFNLFDICVGIIGAAIIYLVVLYKKKNAKKWRKDMEFGSARWGSKKDIEPYAYEF